MKVNKVYKTVRPMRKFGRLLKDLLLPEYSDADKIGYTPEQIKWCEENENYMWRYFIEKQIQIKM